MRKFLLSFVFLSIFSVSLAQQSLRINGEDYSLENFRKNYAKNIETEGYENALANYINYVLLLQRANKQQVDTTAYFKSLYPSKIAELKRQFLDKILYASMDSIPQKMSVNEKVKLLNKLVIDSSATYTMYDSIAVQEVIKTAGEDFINREDTLIFKGNKWIFKTPTGEFTQQNLALGLNYAQKNISEKIKLSELIKESLPTLKYQFVINDYQNNFNYYQPSFKEAEQKLKEDILINYILEKNVYQKYDNKELEKQLKKYLISKQDKYTWPVRYEVEVIRYYKPELKSKIYNALKNKQSIEKLKNKFNKDYDEVAIVVTHGKFPVDHEALGEKFNPKKKIQEGTFRKTPTWIHILKTLPKSPMTVKEADQILKSDFYNHLMGEYFSELNKSAKIEKINAN